MAGLHLDTAPAVPPAARRFECHLIRGQSAEPGARDVVEEQAMRIQVNGEPLATLMRTPGHEVELASGFLLTEGLIRSPRQIAAMSYCPDGSFGAAGIVRVLLTEELSAEVKRRHRNIFSSCSLCGTGADRGGCRRPADLPETPRPARPAKHLPVARCHGAGPSRVSPDGRHACRRFGRTALRRRRETDHRTRGPWSPQRLGQGGRRGSSAGRGLGALC